MRSRTLSRSLTYDAPVYEFSSLTVFGSSVAEDAETRPNSFVNTILENVVEGLEATAHKAPLSDHQKDRGLLGEVYTNLLRGLLLSWEDPKDTLEERWEKAQQVARCLNLREEAYQQDIALALAANQNIITRLQKKLAALTRPPLSRENFKSTEAFCHWLDHEREAMCSQLTLQKELLHKFRGMLRVKVVEGDDINRKTRSLAKQYLGMSKDKLSQPYAVAWLFNHGERNPNMAQLQWTPVAKEKTKEPRWDHMLAPFKVVHEGAYLGIEVYHSADPGLTPERLKALVGQSSVNFKDTADLHLGSIALKLDTIQPYVTQTITVELFRSQNKGTSQQDVEEGSVHSSQSTQRLGWAYLTDIGARRDGSPPNRPYYDVTAGQIFHQEGLLAVGTLQLEVTWMVDKRLPGQLSSFSKHCAAGANGTMKTSPSLSKSPIMSRSYRVSGNDDGGHLVGDVQPVASASLTRSRNVTLDHGGSWSKPAGRDAPPPVSPVSSGSPFSLMRHSVEASSLTSRKSSSLDMGLDECEVVLLQQLEGSFAGLARYVWRCCTTERGHVLETIDAPWSWYFPQARPPPELEDLVNGKKVTWNVYVDESPAAAARAATSRSLRKGSVGVRGEDKVAPTFGYWEVIPQNMAMVMLVNFAIMYRVRWQLVRLVLAKLLVEDWDRFDEPWNIDLPFVVTLMRLLNPVVQQFQASYLTDQEEGWFQWILAIIMRKGTEVLERRYEEPFVGEKGTILLAHLLALMSWPISYKPKEGPQLQHFLEPFKTISRRRLEEQTEGPDIRLQLVNQIQALTVAVDVARRDTENDLLLQEQLERGAFDLVKGLVKARWDIIESTYRDISKQEPTKSYDARESFAELLKALRGYQDFLLKEGLAKGTKTSLTTMDDVVVFDVDAIVHMTEERFLKVSLQYVQETTLRLVKWEEWNSDSPVMAPSAREVLILLEQAMEQWLKATEGLLGDSKKRIALTKMVLEALHLTVLQYVDNMENRWPKTFDIPENPESWDIYSSFASYTDNYMTFSALDTRVDFTKKAEGPLCCGLEGCLMRNTLTMLLEEMRAREQPLMEMMKQQQQEANTATLREKLLKMKNKCNRLKNMRTATSALGKQVTVAPSFSARACFANRRASAARQNKLGAIADDEDEDSPCGSSTGGWRDDRRQRTVQRSTPEEPAEEEVQDGVSQSLQDEALYFDRLYREAFVGKMVGGLVNTFRRIGGREGREGKEVDQEEAYYDDFESLYGKLEYELRSISSYIMHDLEARPRLSLAQHMAEIAWRGVVESYKKLLLNQVDFRPLTNTEVGLLSKFLENLEDLFTRECPSGVKFFSAQRRYLDNLLEQAPQTADSLRRFQQVVEELQEADSGKGKFSDLPPSLVTLLDTVRLLRQRRRIYPEVDKSLLTHLEKKPVTGLLERIFNLSIKDAWSVTCDCKLDHHPAKGKLYLTKYSLCFTNLVAQEKAQQDVTEVIPFEDIQNLQWGTEGKKSILILTMEDRQQFIFHDMQTVQQKTLLLQLKSLVSHQDIPLRKCLERELHDQDTSGLVRAVVCRLSTSLLARNRRVTLKIYRTKLVYVGDDVQNEIVGTDIISYGVTRTSRVSKRYLRVSTSTSLVVFFTEFDDADLKVVLEDIKHMVGKEPEID